MRRGEKRKEERGAIMVMTVLLMTVMLTLTAFVVDLGTQRVARADMQSLADIAALDAARELDGRSAWAVQDSLDLAGGRAKARNDRTVGDAPTVKMFPGILGEDGKFKPVFGDDVPTVVMATAETSVGFAFAPGSDPGRAARYAVASNGDATTCFSVSPTALALDSSGSALGPVLDQILKVNLKVLNPEGLLDLKKIEVPLADIAAELKVGSPEELLALDNISLQDFSIAFAEVLSRRGAVAEAAVLKAIATQISGVTVDVGKILNLDTGGDAGLAGEVNAFDLVAGAVFVANGTNAVDVKGASLVVLGLGGVQELSVQIVEPPQIACGKKGITAKSAQARVVLKSGVDPLGIGATDVKVNLNVNLGQGEGTLTELTCGTSPTAIVTAESDLTNVSGSLTLKVARALSLLSVEAQLGATGGKGGPTPLSFVQLTDGSWPDPKSISASSALILEPIATKATLLGLEVSLGGLLNSVVTPLINGPVDALLETVLELLGITIGNVKIAMSGKVDCQTVKLVG